MSTTYRDLVTPPWVQCGFCKESLQVGVYRPRSCSCGQVFVEYGRAYYKLSKRREEPVVAWSAAPTPVLVDAAELVSV